MPENAQKVGSPTTCGCSLRVVCSRTPTDGPVREVVYQVRADHPSNHDRVVGSILNVIDGLGNPPGAISVPRQRVKAYAIQPPQRETVQS